MDLDSDDAVLRAVAQGNTMDYSKWPAILERLIPRLNHIAHHEFPIPTLPPSIAATQQQTVVESIPQTIDESSQNTSYSTNENDKENATPAVVTTGTATTISPDGTNETLPPQLVILLSSITQTLITYFSENPPHTIQRLAELVLFPTQHYRSLTSYLHAVDRVVHVTSSANIYPLPAAVPDAASASVLSNGIADRSALSWSNPSSQAALGSDESLGGALLTPIPWLRNQNNKHADMDAEVRTEHTETIDGPNGAGSIETVSVSVNGVPSHSPSPSPADSLRAEGGVTQGELLRQEQEAGVIPVSQLTAAQQVEEDGDEEEVPHARGPQEIGMEDMGPQSTSTSERNGFAVGMQGIDVEAAVGRRAEADGEEEENEHGSSPGTPDSAETPKHPADEDIEGDRKRVKEDATSEPEVKPQGDDMVVDTDNVQPKADDEGQAAESTEQEEAPTKDGSQSQTDTTAMEATTLEGDKETSPDKTDEGVDTSTA